MNFKVSVWWFLIGVGIMLAVRLPAAEFQKPYAHPSVEREQVFEFSKSPKVTYLGNDKFEIAFTTKGYCDVTVSIIDEKGVVIRHLASGVLGKNAPPPFAKDARKQTIYWNGQNDLRYFHKDPSRLRVRVSLGLKPVFDKRLGGKSARNAPGYVWGIGMDQSGAYVFFKGPGGHGHVTLRKFDLNGNYIKTVFPPAANTPEKKLAGTGFIEYEPGKKAWHARSINETVARDGYVIPGVNGKGVGDCQVALVGNKIMFLNAGSSRISNKGDSRLYYIFTDGSTDINGMAGKPFYQRGVHLLPRMAASPDGKWVYMVCDQGAYKMGPIVVRSPSDGSQVAKIIVGKARTPGRDNAHLNGPIGIDCDASGRVYVADQKNSRIQIFSADGTFLKTIKVDRPRLVRVHQKNGSIYVQHFARKNGKSISRLTKFSSFENPTVDYYVDGLATSTMTVDSWSGKTRLWLAGSSITIAHISGTSNKGRSVMIYEEQGKTLKKILDFDEEARKEAGDSFMGRWSGSIFDKVVCDATREHVYYRNGNFFDLDTGKRLGSFAVNGSPLDDVAIDRRGYMHVHFNPGFYMPGVGRVDPSQKKVNDRVRVKRKNGYFYPEVPYDYGVAKTGRFNTGWRGILPTKCQPGAKFFQDGIGVNMQGDVAVQSNFYYIPKMSEEGWGMAVAGLAERRKRGEYIDGSMGGSAHSYAGYMKKIREQEKRGDKVYFIPRRPGISLAGATVWTFDFTGELRKESAVMAGRLIGGVMIDDAGDLYFTNNRPRLINGKPFLAGRGGHYGSDKKRTTPFTGTFMKTKSEAMILQSKSLIQMETMPDRPPELADRGDVKGWVNGAEWLYAGASPIVAGGCSCPSMRSHVDWYKRSFVPEAYRHAIGVLDSNGNLILHIGQYGNFDSAEGSKSKVAVGGDEVGITLNRFVSGTDKYLVFEDWGERLMVLKLDYHTEKIVSIKTD